MTRTAEAAARPFDTLLFESAILAIGKFRAWPDHPRFSDSGPTRGYLVVFPRTLVRIAHEGGEPFVAGPDLVTYYNRARRTGARASTACRTAANGSPSPPTSFVTPSGRTTPTRRIAGTGTSFSPPVRAMPGPTFASGASSRPCPTRERIPGKWRRRCWESSRRFSTPSTGIAAATPARRGHPRRSGGPARSLRKRARELGRSFRRSGGISGLARTLDVSPFQLCRIFRRETGTTLHGFRERLRIAAALERLRESRAELTDIALDLGYSSHSHFSASFRREFGVTPSAARAGPAPYRRT